MAVERAGRPARGIGRRACPHPGGHRQFSVIAGVDPKVGLYASFCIAVVIAFAGGRPGMISAATGAMALVMVTLVRDYGLQYLLAATLLTGLLQIGAGLLRLGALMRFVSRSAITGFVNALAILIFLAQLPELTGVTWTVYPMVAAGLAIIYLLPFLVAAGFDAEALLLTGDPETVILDLLGGLAGGLLIMGAYGHSRIRQLIVGSTATMLLRTSPVPVLVMR